MPLFCSFRLFLFRRRACAWLDLIETPAWRCDLPKASYLPYSAAMPSYTTTHREKGGRLQSGIRMPEPCAKPDTG
ncbi:MAG: hypothetical protein ACI4QT_08800 [Kiritimatiellia bacterium]